MKNFLAWLEVQLEWLKSFLSESDGKGSNRRILSTIVVMSFLFAYIKTSISISRIEDIPATWAFLIAGILGLNIVDWYIKMKKNPGDKDEI